MIQNNSIKSDLIQIEDNPEYYARLSDIAIVKLVFSHPNDESVTSGFPKYMVQFGSSSPIKWVLIPVEAFEKYLRKYINE